MKKLLPIAAVASVALLMIFRADTMDAAQNGLRLWKDYVLPALLPYYILISLFISRGTLRANPAALFFLSVLSGAPSGAKLCSYIETGNSKQKSDISAILNTVSPMFIYSSFCSQMLKLPILALPLILAQTAVAAIALLIYNKKNRPVLNMQCSIKKQGVALLASSISSSVNALLGICGAMILFAVILSVLKASKALDVLAFPFEWLLRLFGANARMVKPLLCGMLEITTGTAELTKSGLSIAEAAFCGGFIFSFGGLSILAQSAIFLDINVKRYVLIKFVSAFISGVLALAMSLFISEPSTAVFAQNAQASIKQNTTSFIIIFASSALCQVCVLLICGGCKKIRRTSRAPHLANRI